MKLAVLLAISMAAAPLFADPDPIQIRDTDGNFLNFPDSKTKTLVLIFADRGCPVSNSSVPAINELYAKFRSAGASFVVVFPGHEEMPKVAGTSTISVSRRPPSWMPTEVCTEDSNPPPIPNPWC